MLNQVKYACFTLLLLIGSLRAFAQTNPLPFNLGGGNYSFPSWLNTAPAGTYPPNMFFHVCARDSNPGLADPTTGNFASGYGLIAGNRFIGLGPQGIGMINALKTPVTMGAIVLGLNSTGRTDVTVSWISRTQVLGNAYNIRLQYRISTASPWLDVPGPVEYVYNGSTANTQTLSVNLSQATANAVDNRANMQLRWKYYYVSGFGTQSCLLGVDEINVSSVPQTGNNISTNVITGSPFCVSLSAGAPVTIPFSYSPAAGFTSGSTIFTAELSNSAGQFTSPTILGTVFSNASGSQAINGFIPPGIGTGGFYRIRVISDVPAVTGNDNGSDLQILLCPFNVINPAAQGLNLSAAITWTLPPGCFDEIMVTCQPLVPHSVSPLGNGSAYTADAVFGAGTGFGAGGSVVYKGNGTNVTVTNLINGTLYYFKIWVRYGLQWSSGEEVFCTPGAGTLLKRGDFVVLGVNANDQTCSGGTGPDIISFMCFRDITTGTTLDITDNGWQRLLPNRWGNSEGALRLTRTGGTLVSGTVVTIKIDNGAGTVLAPDPDWSFTNLNPFGPFNLNSGGDQFFFLQGGNWIPGTSNGSHDAQYTGTVLFGFNTNTTWTPFANNTQQSGSFPFLDCYSIAPATGSDWIKFTGTLPASLNAKTQRNWVDSINDPTKWVRYTSGCAAYNAASPNWLTQAPLTILAGGYQRGKWTGAKNTNWFVCDNWEDFVIPDSATDVVIPSAGVTNICRLQLDSTHYCRNLSIQGFKLNGADTNTRVLRVFGNLVITGGELDFSDNNPNTRDGIIYVKGNWVNIDQAFFREGNSKVFLNGPALQTMVTPSQEVFWDLDLDNPGGLSTGTTIQVQNRLSLTNGIITTGSNEVYTTSPAVNSISGYTFSRYINGNLRRQIASSGSYDFPVGTSTLYELATFNFSSQAGISNIVTGFKLLSGTAPNPGVCTINGSPINGQLDAGVWNVQPNALPTAMNMTVTLRMRGHTNSVAPASRYGVIRRDDPLQDWFGSPFGVHANGTQSEVLGTVTAVRSGITSPLNIWGDFGIGFGNAPLPVEWLTFTAIPDNGTIDLDWSTASERDNDYFVLERSRDGKNFEAFGKVQGNGTTSKISNYSFTDYAPYEGISYYRIRQVDYDGRFDFSAIVPVRFDDREGEVLLYPNPAGAEVWIVIPAEHAGTELIRIFDMAGKLVLSRAFNVLSGSNGFHIDLSPLSSGVYTLKPQTGKVLRLIKQ